MVKGVSTHEEDSRELFIVVGHHRRPGSLLGHCKEVVHIVHGTESLLPELKLDGGVELGEAGVEMVLEGVGVGEVDRMGLVGVFRDVREVQAEGLAEAAEFHLALVLQAEAECLLGYLLWNKHKSAQ